MSVPNKDFWLRDESTRSLLEQKLQGVLDTLLILINIFFLGIYQLIYQGNVAIAVLKLPLPVLLGAFIAMPMIFTFVQILGLYWTLKKGGGN